MKEAPELPYIDNNFSMYVILPKNQNNIQQLVQDLAMKQIVNLKHRAFGHEVDVLLPKFEFKSHLGVKEALAEMGVKSAFSSETANFDKMITRRPEAFLVYISEIYQDAWIEVHEEGTRAAAATSTVHYSFGCSAPLHPKLVEFHADQPFLFMIVHNKSRSILFAGWISNPKGIAPQEAEGGSVNLAP